MKFYAVLVYFQLYLHVLVLSESTISANALVSGLAVQPEGLLGMLLTQLNPVVGLKEQNDGYKLQSFHHHGIHIYVI